MKKLKTISTLAIAIMLLMGFMPMLPVRAEPATVYLVPSTFTFETATTSPGYRFTAEVWIRDVTDLYSFQWKIAIDDELLNITNAWLPTLDDTEYVFYGLSSVRPSPAFYDEDGDEKFESVLVGDSIMGAGSFSGTGKLGYIEFEILKAPGKYETLSCTIDIVDAETVILDPSQLDIPFTTEDGYYEYSWTPPAVNPTIAIRDVSGLDPTPGDTLVLIDQYTNISELTSPHIAVDVMIESLDLGWALHNASFTIGFNTPEAILALVNIEVAPEWASFTIDTSVPDQIEIFVEGHASPAGDIRVATLYFNVTFQGLNPPQTESNVSDITFLSYELWNTVGTIPVEEVLDGRVEVQPFLILPLPWLSVVDPTDGDNDIVLGPDLWIGDQYGKTFKVDIVINDLHFAWKLIAAQFRIGYDPSLMEVVDVEEGPFLKTYAQYGTYPIVYIEEDGIYGPHVLFGDIILPDPDTGSWDWMPTYQGWPNGTGVLATIVFKPLVQSWTETYTADFPVKEIILLDSELKTIGFLPPVDGNYTMLPIEPAGRVIDVWMLNYPAPYGGQGLNQPADLVLPQQEVCLTAKVTYNWWPVEGKLVTFKVFDNQGNLYGTWEAKSGADGHAYICFRMPWPGEDLFGVWTIVASVEVADVVVSDTLTFHYDYLINNVKVVTDALEYMHLDTVEVTVDFESQAQQEYTVWMVVEIEDELGVVVAVDVVELVVGGAEYCSYANFTAGVTLEIPYNAYAGEATVRVNFLSTAPEDCGPAVTPETTTTIYILPL